MNTTFNAKSFEELINQLKIAHANASERLNAIMSHCGWAQDNYTSEDSHLGGAFGNLAKTISLLEESLSACYSDVENSFNQYMQETLANEAAAAANVEAEVSQINSIYSGLQQI